MRAKIVKLFRCFFLERGWFVTRHKILKFDKFWSLQTVHNEVRSKQPDITSVVTGSEQFNRTNRERLPEKQKDTLSKSSAALKKDYDRIYNLSDDWLIESVDKLNRLKEDEEARVSFMIMHKPARISLMIMHEPARMAGY